MELLSLRGWSQTCYKEGVLSSPIIWVVLFGSDSACTVSMPGEKEMVSPTDG